MELSGHQEIKYELVSEDKIKTYILNKKRILVGSGESCDFVIPQKGIEGVHAVVEVSQQGIKVYDMNTASGTYVNGQTSIVKDANVGDKICFGDFCFVVDAFDGTVVDKLDDVPPILGSSNDIETSELVDLTPKRVHKNLKKPFKKGSFDKVEYPLEKHANADQLEYIFEPPELIENVLHYDTYEKSIEVTVTIGDRVFSIDYLSADSDHFTFHGNHDTDGVTLPYLGKNETVTFAVQKQGKYFVQKIDGFELMSLSDDKNSNILGEESLSVFMSDYVKVFVRLSESPPSTIEEPFLKNDRIFWKYFLVVMLAVVSFLAFIGIMDVNEELKEKKAPQKLASILYKKPVLSVSVAKKKNKNKKVAQKAKRKVSKQRKKVSTKKKVAVAKKAKSVARKKSKSPKSARPIKKSASKAVSKNKSKGNIDTYKAVDFSASLPNVLSKSSALENIKNEQQENFEYTSGAPSAQNLGSEVKLSKVDTPSANIAGAASKNLADTGELSDFQNDKVMATAGIPSRTIVLGGMDPDTIRKILMDHLPQFRFCYQKELDKARDEFSGRITLNFVIGASGHVTRAGVKESSMPQIVRSCVVNVLRGIPFPSPKGGGVVEVTQPMNFYPKS